MTDKYPHIQFCKHWQITSNVQYMLGECDSMITAISAMPIVPKYHAQLLHVSLTKSAQATTAIEGNTLTIEEIEEITKGRNLPESREYQQIEVQNVLDAMNELLDEVAVKRHHQLITPDLILRFHKSIGKNLGKHFDAAPGRFRTDERVVGTYRCPRHQDVPDLVNSLCEWLQREFNYTSDSQSFAEAVIQAIVTQVYIQWIHPFGDGNGRTGRLLEFYVLLRAGTPDIASHILSNFYNQTRPEYYRQLENANIKKDLTEFIDYAVRGFRDGLVHTLEMIQESQFKTAWYSYIFEKFADQSYRKKNVFKRRRQLILSMPLNQPKTLQDLAILTPQLAKEYSHYSGRTLMRDLQVLEETGLVVNKNGQYLANSDVLKSHMARRLKR